jgi:energy-coupling factor transport system permease protein
MGNIAASANSVNQSSLFFLPGYCRLPMFGIILCTTKSTEEKQLSRYSQLSQATAGGSLAHAIDARAKVIVLTVLSVALWSVDTLSGLGINALLCASMLALAGNCAGKALGGLRRMWSLFLLVVIYYLWAEYSLGGAIVMEGLSEALVSSLMLCGKLALLVTSALWLYFSTPAMKVVHSLATLLRPLEKIRVPVNELGFTVGLVLRTFPSALSRIRELFFNLRRQGKLADTRPGYAARIRRNVRTVIDTMVCYMHYTLHEAESLSLSLMARGYNPFRPAVQTTDQSFSTTDWLFCAVSLTVIVLTSIYL